MAEARHPPWFKPEGDNVTPLMVYNSLTSTKVPFVPIKGKEVKWYICGPTVYDSAHLGHARAYITFDILRRIMSDYFGYDVFFIENITDIDDKIILRARRNYLVKNYREETKDVAIVIKDCAEAYATSIKKFDDKIATLKSEVAGVEKRQQAQMKIAISEEELKRGQVVDAKAAFDELAAKAKAGKASISDVIDANISALSEFLDKQKGMSVPQDVIQQQFLDHARKYEAEFLQDCRNLGVRDPDAVTRVSEYVENIVTFIQQIIDNGYAYESRGSVYFDTVKFSTDPNNEYAKLAPWCAGNLRMAADGEGALADTTSEKRSETDFALWKNSKPGEPSWDCPWGKGRPGWHIECSAMASDLMGSNFDIHGGGEDLKFPHHDNEIAQSEAHSGCKQWVNYFMHAGHLNIQGLKMSKSLKNFISIKEVLKRHSARQIRILFLLQTWDAKMNYSDASLKESASKEKTFNEFFMLVKAAQRTQGSVTENNQVWGAPERTLHEALTTTQNSVHEALCDSFNYPLAMRHLVDLVSAANKYMKGVQNYKMLLLVRVAVYVDRMLRIFGVMGNDDFGFMAGSGDGDGAGNKQTEKIVDAMSTFRDMVRDLAKGGGSMQDILKVCDSLRDDVLPEVGIRLEDVSGGPAVWKLDDPEALMKARDEAKAAAKEAAVSKVQNKINARKKVVDKYQGAKLSPAELYKSMTDKYSKFDEQGMPTHDAKGEELAKKPKKALAKAWKQQEKLHKDYTGKLEKDAGFLAALEAELEGLTAQLAALQ